jgi:hypothetical protein
MSKIYLYLRCVTEGKESESVGNDGKCQARFLRVDPAYLYGVLYK